MPDSNVSSCVLNILSSFSNSLGLSKKLRERRLQKKRWRKNARADEEEMRLSRSLRQGPEDIQREYQRSVITAGDQFEIGDAIARTSLAEILLRLNVGLVGIITSFVNSDKHDVRLDYQSLTDLSERSRTDTCRTLRDLFRRLTQLRLAPAAVARGHAISGIPRPIKDERKSDRKRSTTSDHPKVRGPMLAQVVIQDSSKPPHIAMVRPSERRKKSRSSSGSGSSSTSKSRSEPSLISSAATPPPQYEAQQLPRPQPRRSQTAPDVGKPRKNHSSADVAGPPPPSRRDKLRATKSTSRLEATVLHEVESLPPMPNTVPLPAVSTPVLPPRRRKQTPTYYSIASDSTKLGEIPLHRWNVPYDFDEMSVVNREAVKNGWPVNQYDMQPRKKRTGIFGLFGRKRSD